MEENKYLLSEEKLKEIADTLNISLNFAESLFLICFPQSFML